MTQDVPLTIAFLAGVFSFLSPCVLPIVPGFMSYILGKSFSDIQNTSKLNKLRLLPLILLFILGFSLVFIIMGASIDLISDVFFDYKKQLNFISGLLIIFLGFFFIGIIKFPFLDFERKFEIQKFQNKSIFPFVVGVAFAFGWSPCIGPILGSVLAIAINNSINGAVLLAAYSLGLGIPFIILGFLMGRLVFFIRHLNKYLRYFQIFTGIVLLLTGILILNGSIQSLGFRLNSILPSLEMLLI
jgi:cytochrome c-type biogenesis protein